MDISIQHLQMVFKATSACTECGRLICITKLGKCSKRDTLGSIFIALPGLKTINKFVQYTRKLCIHVMKHKHKEFLKQRK